VHATIGLFEVNETISSCMAQQLQSLLASLCSIVDYELLNLPHIYEGICFGHVLSKACQYSTNDDKVSIGLRQMSVKYGQTGL